MIVQQSTLFAKQKKKLHANQIYVLDTIIHTIIKNPLLGELKKGDLKSIRVYKFNIFSQQYLLAYQIIDDNAITLLALNTHENFYRDLKHSLKCHEEITEK